MVSVWLISSFIYCILILVFIKFLRIPTPQTDYQPSVSILIAMRNEEANLPSLFVSLDALNYPLHKLDIWLLDDHSDDGTPRLARAYAERRDYVHYLRIRSHRNGLTGKMNALAQGVSRSKGDIIFVTDADCQVSPNWINNMVQYFADPAVGMVGGITLVRGYSLLAGLQRFDLMYLLGVASAFTQAGIPLTILGNNMAFTRKAYNAVGGFETIGFSIVEDAALLHAIRQTQKFRILYPLSYKTRLFTRAAHSFPAMVRQRLRWALGGKALSAWWVWLLLLPGILPRVLFWPALGLLPLTTVLSIFGLVAFSDLIFMIFLSRQVNVPIKWWEWLLFELCFTVYLPVLALVTPFKRSTYWKNHKFTLQ